MENNQNNNIFINGKSQIIEMLRLLDDSEKLALFKNMKLRNPGLVEELIEKSFSLNDINRFDDEQIKIVFNNVPSGVLGMALKGLDTNIQKRILSVLPRDYAEEAYQVLKKYLPNQIETVKRAQNKIINTIITLKQKRIIKL